MMREAPCGGGGQAMMGGLWLEIHAAPRGAQAGDGQERRAERTFEVGNVEKLI